MDNGLDAVRDVVNGAKLTHEVRHSILWGLNQLPKLYCQLEQTQDSRHFDHISQHVEGMLNKLKTGKDSPKVAEAMVNLLRDMHERLGVKVLNLKAPAAGKARKKAVSSPLTGAATGRRVHLAR